MAVKLETEWNGLTVDCENMVKNAMAFSGWELDQIVKPTLKKCEEADDGRLHAEMFIFSTVTGRVLLLVATAVMVLLVQLVLVQSVSVLQLFVTRSC